MFCTASSEPNAVWPVDVINTKTGRRCQQFSDDVTFYLIDLSFDIPCVSYFVTCTHEQRILNGTSSDTSLCHWGTWKKKFSQTSQISQIWPDLARSGQIWPDLGRLGKIFFSKKKKNFPDLARSGRPRSGDLARSGSIRVFWSISFFFQRGDPLVAEIPQPNLVAKSADFSKISKKKKFFFFFTSVFEACSLHPRHPSETKKSKKGGITRPPGSTSWWTMTHVWTRASSPSRP